MLSGHQKQADFLCFAKADGILASASQLERAIRTWDVETGALLHVIHAEDVAGVVGSPSHPFVVVTTHEGEGAIVCDSECGRVFKLSAPATAAAFTPDGRSLITGSPGYAAEEGLWTWNLELLLEGGLLDLNGGEIPLANRLDRLALVGEPLDGPQVAQVVPLLEMKLIVTRTPRWRSVPCLFRPMVAWRLLHPMNTTIWSCGISPQGDLQ